MNKAMIGKAAKILVIVGGINWGLALFNINLVLTVFGALPLLVKIVYGAIGASAVYLAYEMFR